MGIFISATHSCGRCDKEEGEESGVEQASQKEDGRKNKWVQLQLNPENSGYLFLFLVQTRRVSFPRGWNWVDIIKVSPCILIRRFPKITMLPYLLSSRPCCSVVRWLLRSSACKLSSSARPPHPAAASFSSLYWFKLPKECLGTRLALVIVCCTHCKLWEGRVLEVELV